jgi:Glyoxalase-like domain
MTCHLLALCFDANDPLRLARFWAGVLGWEMADDPQDGIALLPSDDTGFRGSCSPGKGPGPAAVPPGDRIGVGL